MAKAQSHQESSKKSTTKAQSSTLALAPAPVDAVDEVARAVAGVEQKQLAHECGVSTSLISRMLSTKSGQNKGKDPKLSTLLKLQTGIEKITGQRYPLDSIGALVR